MSQKPQESREEVDANGRLTAWWNQVPSLVKRFVGLVAFLVFSAIITFYTDAYLARQNVGGVSAMLLTVLSIFVGFASAFVVFAIGYLLGVNEGSQHDSQEYVWRRHILTEYQIYKWPPPSMEYVTRLAHRLATGKEATRYDDMLEAAEQMHIRHGHVDTIGLRWALKDNQPFEKDMCSLCKEPRFERSSKPYIDHALPLNEG